MLSFQNGQAVMAFTVASSNPPHKFAIKFDPNKNDVLIYLASLAYEKDKDLHPKYQVTDEQCQELMRTLMLELAIGKMQGKF
jgi:hypothetical protein